MGTRNAPRNGESVRKEMTPQQVFEGLCAAKPAESTVMKVIRWVQNGYEGKVPALLDKLPYDRSAFLQYADLLAAQNGERVSEEIQAFRLEIQRANAMRSPDEADIRVGELE